MSPLGLSLLSFSSVVTSPSVGTFVECPCSLRELLRDPSPAPLSLQFEVQRSLFTDCAVSRPRCVPGIDPLGQVCPDHLLSQALRAGHPFPEGWDTGLARRWLRFPCPCSRGRESGLTDVSRSPSSTESSLPLFF